MPKSKTRVRRDTGEVLPPSKKSDRIRECLKTQLLTFPQKELFEEEIEHWEQDLDPFPVAAIDYAFDCWRRNGRWFPVYGDIIDLCIAWAPPEQTSGPCSAECKRKHWTGYSGQDMIILTELIRQKIVAENRTKEQRLTDAEIDALLDELDKKRGKKPAWRVA